MNGPRRDERSVLGLESRLELPSADEAVGEGPQRIDADGVAGSEGAGHHPVELGCLHVAYLACALVRGVGVTRGGEDLPEHRGLVAAGAQGLEGHREARDERGEDRSARDGSDPMAAEELHRAVDRGGRRRLDGAVPQEPVQVPREGGCGLVAPVPFGGEGAVDDVLQVPAQVSTELCRGAAPEPPELRAGRGARVDPRGHGGRDALGEEGGDVSTAHVLPELLRGERRLAGQQLVQEDAEAVDVGPGVDVRAP